MNAIVRFEDLEVGERFLNGMGTLMAIDPVTPVGDSGLYNAVYIDGDVNLVGTLEFFDYSDEVELE